MVSSGFPGVWKVFLYFAEIQLKALSQHSPCAHWTIGKVKKNDRASKGKERARVEPSVQQPCRC